MNTKSQIKKRQKLYLDLVNKFINYPQNVRPKDKQKAIQLREELINLGLSESDVPKLTK